MKALFTNPSSYAIFTAATKVAWAFFGKSLRQLQLGLQHVSKHVAKLFSSRRRIRCGSRYTMEVFTLQSHPFSELAQYLFNFVLSYKLFIRSTCIFPTRAAVSGDESRNINILGRLVINGFYEFAQTFSCAINSLTRSHSRLRPRSGH